MSDLQKKSLIFAAFLLPQYYLLAVNSALFVYSLVVLFFTIAISYAYFFKLQNLKQNYSDLKFLIMPLLFNFGSSYFLVSLYHVPLRIVFAILITLLNFYMFVALKKVQNLGERAAIFQRNILISITFITLLFSLAAVFRLYVILSTTVAYHYLPVFIVLSVALLFYYLSSFLAWENGLDMRKMMPYNLVTAFLAAQLALVSIVWVVNYPVFSSAQSASLGGLPLPAVFLTIIFYFIWGIVSHKMDKSLTRKIMSEYLFITVLFLLVLLVSTRWLPTI